MNPEQTSKLTDETINRIVHTEVMDECRHKLEGEPYNVDGPITRWCVECGALVTCDVDGNFPCPDYCQDLNAAFKAQDRAIEVSDDGFDIYATALLEIIAKEHALAIGIANTARLGALMAIATARQRMEAVIIALGIEPEGE